MSEQESKFVEGTQAAEILGIRPKGKAISKVLEDRYSLRPEFQKKFGRGYMYWYLRSSIEEAKSKVVETRKKNAERIVQHQYMPTRQAVEIISRIESKIDRLLSIWDRESQ